MAQKVKLKVGIAVDGEKEFKKVISSINSEARVLATEMKKITAEYSGNANSLKALTEKDRVLNDQIDKQKEKITAMKAALENAKKEYGENDTRTDMWKASLNTAEKQLSELNSELKKNSQYLDEAKKSTNNTASSIDGYGRDVKEAEEATSDFKDTLSAVVTGGVILEGLDTLRQKITDITGEAIGFSTSSQKGVNDFAAATGVATEEMAEYKDKMKEVYADNFGEDMNDISSVMAEIKQQCNDISPENIKDVTENAITLRDTFDMDIKEQMRAVNMLVDQFGISGQEAFNLIAQGAQSGLNKNDDLLDSINEYAVHYKQMGATAEDFFNSLANGTEKGTFSVDKLGDAYKEFGIRVKDTASSTTEGFELLGYHAATPKEQIEKLKNNISGLEQNLRYAKKEQEGFNSKTNELTKQKNADKIAKYSKELAGAKSELAEIQKKGGDSANSIKKLQNKFTEGGDSAKKATQEVLQRLLDMDDKVKQNQAGVDLFGTMWEDLGKDGVVALMDLNGEISTSKEALEDIKEVKYDDLGAAIEGVRRNLIEDIAEPIEEKALPKVSELAEKLQDNGDIGKEVGNIASDAIGVVVDGAGFVFTHLEEIKTSVSGIILAFAAVKTVNAFGSTATSILEMKRAIDAARASQTALNIAQKANIVGAVTGAVIGLGTAIATLVAGNNDAADSTSGLTEKQKELIEESKKANDEINQSLKSANERVKEVEQEFKNTAKLKNELNKIIDKNGKIKKGYKDQAKLIVNDINDALGTNLSITEDGKIAIDGQVKKQKDLNKQLDKTLEKKQAEKILDLQGEEYIKNQTKLKAARERYAKDTVDIDFKRKQAEDEEKKANEWKKKLQDSGGGAGSQHFANEMYNHQKNAEKLKKEVAALEEKASDTKKTMDNLNRSISNYEALDAAIATGSQKKIKAAMYNIVNDMKTTKTATKEELKAQYDEAKKHYDDMSKLAKEGKENVSKEDLEGYKKLRDQAKKEYDKAEKDAKKGGKKAGKGYASGVDSQKGAAKTAAKDIGKEAAAGLESTKSEAETSGKNFIEGFIKGTNGKQASAVDVVKGLASGIIKTFNDELEIKSPSRKAMRSGAFFVEGAVKGLREGKSDISNAARSLAGVQSESFRRSLASGAAELSRLNDMDSYRQTVRPAAVIQPANEATGNIGSGDLKLSVNLAGKPIFDTVYKEFRKAKTRDPNISLG